MDNLLGGQLKRAYESSLDNLTKMMMAGEQASMIPRARGNVSFEIRRIRYPDILEDMHTVGKSGFSADR